MINKIINLLCFSIIGAALYFSIPVALREYVFNVIERFFSG